MGVEKKGHQTSKWTIKRPCVLFPQVVAGDNKTRTSKVGAISKAQKVQNMKFFRKMSHSAENVKGGPFGFINIHSVAKYQKTRRGTLWEH